MLKRINDSQTLVFTIFTLTIVFASNIASADVYKWRYDRDVVDYSCTVPANVTAFTIVTQDEFVSSFQKRDVCSGYISSNKLKTDTSTFEAKPLKFIKFKNLSLSNFSFISTAEAAEGTWEFNPLTVLRFVPAPKPAPIPSPESKTAPALRTTPAKVSFIRKFNSFPKLARNLVAAARPVPKPGQAPAPIRLVRTLVTVPSVFRTGTFSVSQYLDIPVGYDISVIQRLDRPRFMLLLPTGDILISQPGSGRVSRLTNSGGSYSLSTFASNLKNPHDMVLGNIGGKTYLYISESNKVTRSEYVSGDTSRRTAETIVYNLPDGNSSSALQGSYGHELKSLAMSPQNDKLYVSVASASNADPQDLQFTPKQGALYEFDPQASTDAITGGRLYAEGIRNPSGMAFKPGTNELWVNMIGRDNVANPATGAISQSYVDENPSEMLIKVRDGGNYGWPFCNADGKTANGFANMPYNPDYVNNRNNSVLNCASVDRSVQGYPAHSTPLGLTFLQDTSFSLNGILTALRACWNCSKYIGSKIVYMQFDSNGNLGSPVDFIKGWVTSSEGKRRFGTPVDIIPDNNGDLIITDDTAGVVYKLSPK